MKAETRFWKRISKYITAEYDRVESGTSPGIPDVIIYKPEGTVLFVENKQAKSKLAKYEYEFPLRPSQRVWMRKAILSGQSVRLMVGVPFLFDIIVFYPKTESHVDDLFEISKGWNPTHSISVPWNSLSIRYNGDMTKIMDLLSDP